MATCSCLTGYDKNSKPYTIPDPDCEIHGSR